MAAITPTPSSAANHFPPDSTHADIDQALEALRAAAPVWARTPIAERIDLLGELHDRLAEVSAQWAEASARAEGTDGTPQAGEEWLVGPYLMQRNIRLLREALVDIRKHGRPRIPGPVKTRANGQVTARVFPASLYDMALFPGVTAEVWMEPGVSAADLPSTQALAYTNGTASDDATSDGATSDGATSDGAVGSGGVALVLGAGNVTSIGPTDALYKFFVENRVVIYKMHPLNAFLGPLIERAFEPLVRRGALRVVYGGADIGEYLCNHPQVDEIHITGSDRTVEAIVFGLGEEGARRKAEHRPRLDKPISAELGNVSAVIVVPGPWSDKDVEYQAENLVSSLANNAGFNCNATRVVVQQEGWFKRQCLLDEMRRCLAKTSPRPAYYPGAAERFERFRQAHPEAEAYGEPAQGELPWLFIPELPEPAPSPEGGPADDICFRTEAFCGVFSETALAAETVPEFLERAVDFVNEQVWGTLNVTLIVHPGTTADSDNAAALERALERLRFGTVSVNHWAAVGFGLMTTTWGAFPGHDLYDLQSGLGVVHNTLMFARPQKTVVRSLFEAWPKPPWFVSHRTAYPLAKALADFERAPSPLKLLPITWYGVRG